MRAMISRFLADRAGATAVEYAMIVLVLSLAIVAGIGNATNSVVDFWLRLSNDFNDGFK